MNLERYIPESVKKKFPQRVETIDEFIESLSERKGEIVVRIVATPISSDLPKAVRLPRFLPMWTYGALFNATTPKSRDIELAEIYARRIGDKISGFPEKREFDQRVTFTIIERARMLRDVLPDMEIMVNTLQHKREPLDRFSTRVGFEELKTQRITPFRPASKEEIKRLKEI